MREPTEMEWRVAIALWLDDHTSDTRDDGWKVFLPSARAAIRAMREPTREMVLSGNMPGFNFDDDDLSAAWQEMIYAASPEVTDDN